MHARVHRTTLLLLLVPALAAQEPGEGPALGLDRITQADIQSGALDLAAIRAAGLKMFATPFNVYDGLGDGPMDPFDTTSPGGRPTLQGNGMFLRVNGLDAQTCMECHSVGSNLTRPFTFAVGGVGTVNNNAMFKPTEIDVDDEAGAGHATFDGRFINPPFLFGSGGVELLGKEMTSDLQTLREVAFQNPDTDVALETHGVSFGVLRYDSATGEFDVGGVEGVDADLVVRPFGRKGEFATVRGFDVEALAFHFGMQPVETVGPGIDGDGDGVVDEVLVGELSALHIFNTNLERPLQQRQSSPLGAALFESLGCAECHVPRLETQQQELVYSFPEVEEDPGANAFYSVNLAQSPAGFEVAAAGGLVVPLFSDLKRHDMGPGLAETFGSRLDAQFVTARLWGVADTAPYLHDGRATTLTDAILAHGGEAQAPRDAFAALGPQGRVAVLGFLRTLRTPRDPAQDLLEQD